jgi:hypothetical protein
MTLKQIYDYVNSLISTDDFGGALNLLEFNLLISDYNMEFFKKNVEELYVNQRAGALNPDLVYSSKVLRPFITSSTQTPLTGVVAISSLSSFAYIVKIVTNGAYNGQVRKIDLISHDELYRRIDNLLEPPLTEKPAAVIEGANIKIYPTNITSVNVAYLKYPATPIFDYYIDAYDVEQYLAPSTSRALGVGETGSLGQTSVTVNSLSVELEYPVDFHPEFVQGLVAKLGLPLRDQIVMQKGELDLQKTEAK